MSNDLEQAPAVDVRPLLGQERADLVAFLRTLTPADWDRRTAVPGWTVRDIALHILGDDLGWLSRGRDGERSGRLDPRGDYRDFVHALGEKNQRFVDGLSALSNRVLCGLIVWAGCEIDEYFAEMDLRAEGSVIWASDGPVPVWFDIAADLTERWVHQLQMREALNSVGDFEARYLPVVLRTFVWALPHQYRVWAPKGTT
ncbi:MAG TPA: maleylpyruvate isomerase N-terminal domain-containing protein, partial [Dermatophilaceae bacterium]